MSALLTKHEVAARLQVAPRTVLDFAARGALASVRLGRCVRFEAEAVEAFVAANRCAVSVAVPAPPPQVRPPTPLPAPRKDYFA